MKSSMFVVCSLSLNIGCGTSSPTQDVGSKKAAVRGETISGDKATITYPQIYCTADGESHLRDVTVDLTLTKINPLAPPFYLSTTNPELDSRWTVFPKGWNVEGYQQRQFHPVSHARFVSIVEGTFVIQASDGEERIFKKGDTFEALDVAPCKGQLAKSDDGMVAFLTDHLEASR